MFAPLGSLVAFTGGLMFMKYYFNREKNRLRSMIGTISKKITSSKAPAIEIENEDIYTNENTANKSRSSTT